MELGTGLDHTDCSTRIAAPGIPTSGSWRAYGLPQVVVFSGTHEVLNTDSRSLLDEANAAGVAVEYLETYGLPHVYPLLPTPEGRDARKFIAQVVAGAQ